MPRFDSPACFAALLGGPEHGRWLVAPVGATTRVTRRYRGDTLILETEFETVDGAVCVVDFMARRDGASDLVRIVRGLRGTVAFRTELAVRYDHGAVVPWVARQEDGCLHFTAGPDRLVLDTAIALRGEHMRSVGEFSVAAGEEVAFALTWSPSYRASPAPLDIDATLKQVEALWLDWEASMQMPAKVLDAVRRSLITLKALAHWETGGIVAAATTSLPEKIGGARNWDYRYCWLRDATFTLYALLVTGSSRRPAPGETGWCVRWRAARPTSRSCTA